MGSIFYSKRICEGGARRGSRHRSRRPKTFSSEEAARKWAEAQELKGYTLVNLRSPENREKKIRVVIQ